MTFTEHSIWHSAFNVDFKTNDSHLKFHYVMHITENREICLCCKFFTLTLWLVFDGELGTVGYVRQNIIPLHYCTHYKIAQYIVENILCLTFLHAHKLATHIVTYQCWTFHLTHRTWHLADDSCTVEITQTQIKTADQQFGARHTGRHSRQLNHSSSPPV